MADITVPNQYSSGDDTFSDNLVGFQIVDGSSQMTATSFTIDRVIPEKDSKNLQTQPFSEFITLDTIKEENTEVESTSSQVVTEATDKIKFYDAKNDGTKSIFGSLSKRLSVTVQNIILKYPAGIYVDKDSPIKSNPYVAWNLSYSYSTKTTTFTTQKSLFFNPFDIVLSEPEGITKAESTNEIRNLYSSFKKYVIDISGTTYNVLNYTEPNSSNEIVFEVEGDCFGLRTQDLAGYNNSFLIRPNDGVVEEFYKNLDEIEIVLLDRETDPKFQGKFRVPKDINDGESTKIVTQIATWPVSDDNWNVEITGIDFDGYLTKLSSIGDEVDNYKSNLIVRFLTAPQLFEFDTEDQKAEAMFQIYGQSFDKVKKFIDNIAYMRNVSYDKIKNVPDLLLKNLAVTLGLSTVGLFDEDDLQNSLYTRTDTQYIGLNLGKNLIEAEYEFYRRILVNLAHVYKSKGTRQAIEFFLKFIGAPEPMIRFDEYIYRLNGTLPKSTYEDDIRKAILGTYVTHIATYTGSTIEPTNGYGSSQVADAIPGQPPIMSDYVITSTTGSTTLTRDEYPVDPDTGLPRGSQTEDGEIMFQLGAGWYKKTIEHRSHDILDTDRSNLTGRTKVIKTTSKPFTYGEDYFDYFRRLPGLDYGYELTADIDNSKTEVVITEQESQYILNRKNINIFLSADRAIDYDIYTKSRNLSLTFGTMAPPTGLTFAEFLTEVLNDIITNSNVIRYERYYQALDIVYNEYKNNTNFTPYNYIKVNEFIDRMSPYWTQIIDQFVPATTLWLGGNVIENGTLNRSKFWYKKPCVPVEIIENLYPDFCGILEEDLETIIGGGTTKGVDVAEDYLRELFTFSGFTYILYLDVNGNLYTGTTEPIIEEVLSGFTKTADCTSLVDTKLSVPLICEFKDWVFCNLDAIKIKWIAALEDLVDNINSNSATTGVSLTYEIFTDTDGVEKIRFIVMNEECIDGDDIDFYFEPSYSVPRTECDLRVEVSTPEVFYIGESVPCSECDPAYEWTQLDENTCFRNVITGATAPASPIELESKPFSTYSEFGTKVFDTGYNTDGTGTVLTTLTGYDVWENVGSTVNEGPLNRCALWTKAPTYPDPDNTWLGFGICLSGISETKTYYVGTGADNHYRIVLDGVTLVDSSLQGTGTQEQFKYWHLYPVEIGGGEHVLEVYGLNEGGVAAGFGCEVYDNTYSEIVNATTYGDLTVLLTSSGQTEASIVQDTSGNYQSSGYTCPTGYDPPFVYSPCSGTCVQYVECDSPSTPSFSIDECKLNSDIYLTIVNDNYDGNGGYVTGIEEQNPEPVNIYVTTGTTCDTLVGCYACDGEGWQQYDNEYCYRTSTTGATAPASPVTLVAKGSSVYSNYGTKVFENGFNSDGSGTPSTILTGTEVWHNTPTPNSTKGPMNRCALWDAVNTTYTWYGFGKCLSGVTETKTYYVGIAADNHYKLLLDQELILDTSTTSISTEKFNYWHIYPVEIGAGDHNIYLFGYNAGSIAGFGCEIYDNTYEEIINATSYGDLNVLFTSSGVTEATFVQDSNGIYQSSGYVCPDGYTYSDCDGTCVQVEYCYSPPITATTAGNCTDCSFDEASFSPIETTDSGCTYLISGASETNVYDIIIGDAANCERKFRIEGLSPNIVELGGSTGYTVYPKVQYKTSDNFGIKKGTVVYREVNEVPLNTWEDLQNAVNDGNIVEVEIESVSAGDILISINPKDSSEFSIIDVQNALNSNGSFDFTFDYNRVEILNVECLSSIKKNIVNEEFELLPTSKVYVYSNINESLERVPFHFTFKYPEDLYIKSTGTTEDPCCPYPDNENDVTDRLIDQYGFLIDVTSVNLNYCEGGIYYRVDYKNATSYIQRHSQPPPEPTEYIRLLNGASTGTTRLIVAHEKEEFECLNMKLQHYFVNSGCTTVPTIEELERNPCGLPDCEPVDCDYTFTAEESALAECLASTTFIVQYSYDEGPCPGGHYCDCATFYLMANETNIGTAYLSNTGGQNDIFNYPAGETSGPNRYNEIMMSPEQAQEISVSAVDGIVDFSLECALPPTGTCANRPTGCHEDVTWIKMIRDGVTIYEGCPEGNFISMNPCTGEIVE